MTPAERALIEAALAWAATPNQPRLAAINANVGITRIFFAAKALLAERAEMVATDEKTPMSGKSPIPRGTLIFHDHGVFRWPKNNNRDDVDDPDMLFDINVDRGAVRCVADGFGTKGDYGNGSILIKLSHWREAWRQE
jgi:hypothetical protein